MAVKYTDVDYYVFTDAAKLITENSSPYLRPTYRYTPLLAQLLTPNILISPEWGKFLFVFCDLVVGLLLYRIVQLNTDDKKLPLRAAQLWLFNPLVAGVSTRGNAESLVSAVVLISLYFLSRFKATRRTSDLLLSAVCYGAAVHLKIYPAIYCLSIYLYLYEGPTNLGSFRRLLQFNRSRLVFMSISLLVFSFITSFYYHKYGYEFLYETYLYHVIRRDIRHNFSAYFLSMYLSAEDPNPLIGLASFLPQAIVTATVSFKYYEDLGFTWFLTTFAFVTFNKVCTSQYFLWYISLLPLTIARLHIPKLKMCSLFVSWILGQGLWLTAAFYFEFRGFDSFVFMWAAGVAFLFANTAIVCTFISYYR